MPAAKRRTLVSAFEWDATVSRYRRKLTGQFVGRTEIETALRNALRRAGAEMRATGIALQAGRITVTEWREAMAASIKQTHLYAAALPRGGWGQLTAADFGRVGQRVREQYAYLNRFTAQLAGGMPLDGRFLNRAAMYAGAARRMQHESERVEMLEEQGLTQERNVLGNAEHCATCIEQTARGWVPIGSLAPIGTRDCLTNCRCRIRYR